MSTKADHPAILRRIADQVESGKISGVFYGAAYPSGESVSGAENLAMEKADAAIFALHLIVRCATLILASGLVPIEGGPKQ